MPYGVTHSGMWVVYLKSQARIPSGRVYAMSLHTHAFTTSHTRAKNGTDVSLLSVVITAVAPTQSFSASEQGGVNLVQGSRDTNPTPKLQTWLASQCPKHRHLAVFLHLILPVLSFPAFS